MRPKLFCLKSIQCALYLCCEFLALPKADQISKSSLPLGLSKECNVHTTFAIDTFYVPFLAIHTKFVCNVVSENHSRDSFCYATALLQATNKEVLNLEPNLSVPNYKDHIHKHLLLYSPRSLK